MERVICNPVSGKSITITLPEVIARSSGRRGYFGYDPINKQFKVLCHTYGELETNDSQVLTLETGNLIWRRTMECKPHSKGYGEICINGVLYYKAHIDGSSRMIVCFDFSSEKFSFFKIHEDLVRGTLVNYKGKLGVLGKDKYQLMLWVLEEDAGLMLWVLEEDAGNHNWCKRISVELKTCDGIVNNLYVVGMTGAGEIVFSPNSRPNPFYIVYSNIERKAFTRVYIQGFEEFLERRSIFSHIFVDYVENFKLL
ncbi:unnamed protein product [Microthlaspi erraticum]|uniref:F-box associated beta-propeller type 3 domain-containing protein n=1 Tax=Microthlaspi erraticum TaxID=1685480 RepID=A0A6D2HP84_9BRAS|nr:unnamed protein product [Microthlaspi erraticum]